MIYEEKRENIYDYTGYITINSITKENIEMTYSVV